MGSYTYGSLECYFDRQLTESEVDTLVETLRSTDREKGQDGATWTFSGNSWDINDDNSTSEQDIIVEPDFFMIEVATKAYDLEDAVKAILEHLPPDVWVKPAEGFFETEGEHWGIQVRRRQMRAVSAELLLPEWPEPALIKAAQQALKGGEQ